LSDSSKIRGHILVFGLPAWRDGLIVPLPPPDPVPSGSQWILTALKNSGRGTARLGVYLVQPMPKFDIAHKFYPSMAASQSSYEPSCKWADEY